MGSIFCVGGPSLRLIQIQVKKISKSLQLSEVVDNLLRSTGTRRNAFLYPKDLMNCWWYFVQRKRKQTQRKPMDLPSKLQDLRSPILRVMHIQSTLDFCLTLTCRVLVFGNWKHDTWIYKWTFTSGPQNELLIKHPCQLFLRAIFEAAGAWHPWAG